VEGLRAGGDKKKGTKLGEEGVWVLGIRFENEKKMLEKGRGVDTRYVVCDVMLVGVGW